ncbi:nucleotidyltransferase family protein [Aurantiacibacter marinus]|uniref:nucleotidyltransferase family protein n=1 Tax=Aurantiacibacter marinus TaxID=874156 RepID=UPI00138E50CC|nr:nucleotidyltransferase family protein [Aurantiacibacter marinus]
MPEIDSNTGIILLAAGRGRRFGRDKLQEVYGDQPLWIWAAKAAEDAGFTRRYIVRAAHSPAQLRDGWQEVINPDAHQGMGTSIAAGVKAARTCSRLVLALADMPLVEPSHLARLALGSGTIFTSYGDAKTGSPAAFPASVFSELRSLAGEAGAKTLALANVTVIEPRYHASLGDVDTAEDLAKLCP